MKKKYLSRVADKVLKKLLDSSGAVLIEGPKWCGKTRTAEENAKSVIYMQDPDNAPSYIRAADTKPSILLMGNTPRLIDEWQEAPVLWDTVRFEVDKRGKKGQFILTGSASPSDNVTRHTGTGRISRFTMRPMSLFESLESNGSISLKALFDGAIEGECASSLTIEKLAYSLARGGWPSSIGEKHPIALSEVSNYVESVINMDVSRVDGIEKNPARVRMLLRAFARNVSTTATLETIRTDISGDETSLSDKTVAKYLNALKRIFVVEDLPAWNPAMRSKTAIRATPKRHLIDPSIAIAVLRASPESLLHDFESFGLFFESLCIRDLRIYAQGNDGEVFHYRDKSGLEADAIVYLNDGRWGAFEIKMGASEIETAAANLVRLRNKVNTDKMMEPSFLAVLTCTEFGYRRDDGVYILPIGCLRD